MNNDLNYKALSSLLPIPAEESMSPLHDYILSKQINKFKQYILERIE